MVKGKDAGKEGGGRGGRARVRRRKNQHWQLDTCKGTSSIMPSQGKFCHLVLKADARIRPWQVYGPR